MRFASDHFIEAIRDQRRPGPSMVRRVMARRSAYLQKKMVNRALADEPIDFMVDELGVIAVLMELYERENPRSRAATT